MTYLKSKTFWGSVCIILLETAQAAQVLTLSSNQAHFMSIAIAFLIAINRILKN